MNLSASGCNIDGAPVPLLREKTGDGIPLRRARRDRPLGALSGCDLSSFVNGSTLMMDGGIRG